MGPRYQALADGQYVLAEGRHSTSTGLAGDADPSWSLEKASVWWVLLPESKYEAPINKDPEKYGNLNSIDMASRARANELVLDGYLDAAGNRIPRAGPIEKTQSELDELSREIERAHEDGREVSSDLRDRQENLQNCLADLETVRGQVRGNAGATLLVPEPGKLGENVRAAIVIGDVDNVQHVATLVPGMGPNLHDSGRPSVELTKNLKWAADTYGAPMDGSVATVTQTGYEVPPGIMKTRGPSVVSIDRAETGVEKLNGFVMGIHLRRLEQGLDMHQSTILHSHGPTAAGVVMHDIGRGVVDDLVYTGFSGAGVHSVGTLRVDPGHAWASATPHSDPVWGKGPDYTFGRNPEHLERIGHPSGDMSGGEGYKHDIWHKPDANCSSYFHRPEIESKHSYALEDIGKVTTDKKERRWIGDGWPRR